MDAGIAALLGASLGAISTIALGVLTKSTDKMRLNAESLRDRREPRRASYEALAWAATALHDHMEPWIKVGRRIGVSPSDDVTYLRSKDLRDGYLSRAIELADDVRRAGHQVVLNGPAKLEPYATRVTEAAADVVAPFRIMHLLNLAADEGSSSAMAYTRLDFLAGSVISKKLFESSCGKPVPPWIRPFLCGLAGRHRPDLRLAPQRVATRAAIVALS
ncbi:hypothetical protein GCM10018785_10560 [Streptomyces longispororuber]|uniref:Uncharacterized protein n=1 Tax=Streptomyces longispororuber TaxID=68230 RepID=A0A918ZB41_9ACTN|nr:hypothetical protein GCM10018785_10560 [Streptomyces longispororuber]